MYVIEVNPRASRTVPYVSKATGVPLAKMAARLMTGRKLRELLPEQLASGKDLETGAHYYVKSPVFPWSKFAGVDTVLGPEMKSTGEVMGVAATFGEAFAKAQLSAGQVLPMRGTVFFSVNDHDKTGCRLNWLAGMFISVFTSLPRKARPMCWSVRGCQSSGSSR